MKTEQFPKVPNSYDVDDAVDEPIPEQLTNTRLSDDPVADYFQRISKTPLLTAEQEVELAKQIEVGLFAQECLRDDGVETNVPVTTDELELLVAQGATAKEQFVTANLRLVMSIAREYPNDKLSLLDLIQAGNEGLIRAVEKFDYTKGFKFSVYAREWIHQRVRLSIASDGRTIRIPVHAGEKLNSIKTTIRDIESTGQIASDEAVAESTGLSPARIKELRVAASQTATSSLDQALPSNGGYGRETHLADFVADPTGTDDPIMSAMGRSELAQLLATLEPDEQYLLIGRKSLVEMASELGIAPSDASITKRRALAKLRHPATLWMLGDRAPDWSQDASCQQIGREVFFPKKGDKELVRDVKRVCSNCAVVSQCLLSVEENSTRFGIFGGTSPKDR